MLQVCLPTDTKCSKSQCAVPLGEFVLLCSAQGNDNQSTKYIAFNAVHQKVKNCAVQSSVMCSTAVRFGRSEIFPCEPETISCPRALVLLPLNINSPRASIPAFGILTHTTDSYPLRISQCDIPNRCRWIWGNLWRKFYNIRLLCSMQ